jgi:hypothetical protein
LIDFVHGVLDGDSDARITTQKFYFFRSTRLVLMSELAPTRIEPIHSRPWLDIELKVHDWFSADFEM